MLAFATVRVFLSKGSACVDMHGLSLSLASSYFEFLDNGRNEALPNLSARLGDTKELCIFLIGVCIVLRPCNKAPV